VTDVSAFGCHRCGETIASERIRVITRVDGRAAAVRDYHRRCSPFAVFPQPHPVLTTILERVYLPRDGTVTSAS
jgi:hypothetical protein